MNSFYGGGGVESRHAPIVIPDKGMGDRRVSRSSDRPASTFHGSQSGATSPGPSNPAGRHLSTEE